MSVPNALETRHAEIVAREVGCRPAQVVAAAALFADGATVPFVARYRKEVTDGLTDADLERIAARRAYFLELAQRREVILASVAGQQKLTPELERALREADTKTALEDLYLPYRPKRRSRAQTARERGLEPLADALLAAARNGADPAALAAPFVDAAKDLPDVAAALAGARDIVAERVAERADLRARLRRVLAERGELRSTVAPERVHDEKAATYRDYFQHAEPLRRVPSHRMLAILRGEKAGFLKAEIAIDDERETAAIVAALGADPVSPCGREVAAAAADGYRRLLRPSIETEVRNGARERAEAEAIAVFRANLEALLLTAPFGEQPVMGLDPGVKSGCKVAVVDATGKVLASGVVHVVPPKVNLETATRTLLGFVEAHGVRAVAVGNGTAGRETELAVRRILRDANRSDVVVTIVPETGASVYSASPIAREELPDLDVSIRGAVSIARRLKDPLAELVKIQPRALGVGQYQHDLDQRALGRELDVAVEGVVNRVGVELNTASVSLLKHVSGLGERLASAIVARRDEHGAFRARAELREVPGVGEKTFSLAAGFLRVRGGACPLDATAVHPESYPIVEAMAEGLGVSLGELVGNPELARRIDVERFVDEARGVGRYTLDDIRAELERPGRDPRPEFVAPAWRDDVQTLEDLKPGMELEGRVSNVTNFGAFVDVGVKRDGLVHLSEVSERRVQDPREVVAVGQVVKVRVLSVDRERERINLTMRPPRPAAEAGHARPGRERDARRERDERRPQRRDGGRPGGGRAQRGGPGSGGGAASKPPPRAEPKPRRDEPPRPPSQESLDALLRKFGRS